MHVEIELSLQVVGTELAKAEVRKLISIDLKADKAYWGLSCKTSNLLSFIPCDDIRYSNLVHPCEKGQEREYQGCYEELIFIEYIED